MQSIQSLEGVRTPSREAAEDVFFGQVVMIWARWGIIAAGITLILFTNPTPYELTLRIGLVVTLMAVNFFLHGRYMMEKPANRHLILLASLLDLGLITAIVASGLGAGVHGDLFVFYYPVVVAFALVFPPRLTAVFTAVAVLACAGASALGPHLGDVQHQKELLIRFITIAAVGGLGTFYWRILRERRRQPGAESR